MATTNIIQWNPSATNQETDAAYLADSMRAGGAVDPAVFLSVLANKAFYQWSTYLTALFNAFAAKGFTTSDSNLSTLTAQCAHFLTTADVLPAVQTVPYAASLALNAGQANGFYIAPMTGNLTISAVTGLTAGQLVTLSYQQDGVGGRTVTFPSSVVGGAQPDPAPNAVSTQLFVYDAVTSLLRAVGPLVGTSTSWFAGALDVDAALRVVGTATLGALTLTSPGSAGEVLTNVGGVFVPQPLAGTTMSDVTSSRDIFGGTTYTNTTPYRMTVCVTGDFNANVGHNGLLTGYVNGVQVAASSAQNGGGLICVTFVVPSGYTYKTTFVEYGSSGATLTISSWIEWVN